MARYKLEVEFDSNEDPQLVIRNIEKYIDRAIPNYCVEDAEVDCSTIQVYDTENPY